MDRLLNEQEMKAISKVCNSRSCKTCPENSYGADYCGYEIKVAKAQLAKVDIEWVKWADDLLRLLIKHDDAFPCSCYRRAFRIVADRKKLLEENK
jgi:hypothetical protein